MVEAAGEESIEHALPGVAEGGVAEVVAERDRLGQVLVEPQARARVRAIWRDLQRVGEAGAVVVALGGEEDLRLAASGGGRTCSGGCGRGRAGRRAGWGMRPGRAVGRRSCGSARRGGGAWRLPRFRVAGESSVPCGSLPSISPSISRSIAEEYPIRRPRSSVEKARRASRGTMDPSRPAWYGCPRLLPIGEIHPRLPGPFPNLMKVTNPS